MVNKITTPPTTSELIGTVNEIIDDKQDKLTVGTGISISSGNVISVTAPTLINSAYDASYNLSVFGNSVKGMYNTIIGNDASLTVSNSSQANTVIGGRASAIGNSYILYATAVGFEATAYNNGSISIGSDAITYGLSAIQIGTGTNNTDYSLQVGFRDMNNISNSLNYQLLDGTTGLIPDARISSNIARSADVPTDTSDLTNGAGYITGITSSDVTTALGYTPYNSSNPSNYQTATQVANSIATETTNRENADNNLQSQIDAIVSASDVFDIVGTYEELQAYDITTVPVNDIIKVLVDSTHSGAATYYRCVATGGVKSWSYIGSEGAYYTKAESDAAFVPQTRTVNNKALSANITLTASDVEALPSSTVIPTVNNPTITITQGGVSKGSFTLNQTTGDTIDLDAGGGYYTAGTGIDITNDVISITSPTLTNTSTGTDSLAILSSFSGSGGDKNTTLGKDSYSKKNNNVVIGYSATNYANTGSSDSYNVAIGSYATTYYEGAVAIGSNARSNGHSTIQIGKGQNTTDYTLQIGFYQSSDPTNPLNYTLLDGTTGYIPNARINMDSTPTSSSTNTVTSGGVYTALGDKQDTLVSGTNIKTVNNQSLLGSGNITITGGGAVDSVNGYTGIVVLTAGDVGVEAYTAAEVQTIWESV